MVTAARFKALSLALPNTTMAPHFERTAFRTPARIFATIPDAGGEANLKLDPEHQELFIDAHPEAFVAIDNGFGRQGWTTVILSRVSLAAIKDALRVAHAIASEKKKSSRKRSK